VTATAAKVASTRSPVSVTQEEAERFTMFAFLRLLEARSGGARLGETVRIKEDPVRIVQELTMRFAPGEVAAAEDAGPLRLHIENFGVFGCNGALPAPLTEYAAVREREDGDRVFIDFVNLMQHRMATLFYRAWASAEPTVDFESFRSYLAALVGIGDRSLAARDHVEDDAKYHRAGRLAPAIKNLAGLEDVLADYFACDVRVEPFDPRWLDIPPGERSRLGAAGGSRLGVDANPGQRSWQCQFSFRIVVRNLRFERFLDFLPGQRALEPLHDLVLLYAGLNLHWTLELRLAPGEAPQARLGGGGKLGWTTWLGGRYRDRASVRIRGESAARYRRTRVQAQRRGSHG